MQGLQGASRAALDFIVGSHPAAWTISSYGTLGVLIASLEVRTPEQATGFSVSVTGWTQEELQQRMELIRAGAAALLDRWGEKDALD